MSRAIASHSKSAALVQFGLWALGLLLFPFYTYSKGTVQISSLVFAMLFAVLLFQTGRSGSALSASARRAVLLLGLFVLYTALVTLVWAILLSETSMLIMPVYYLFDFFVFISTLTLYGLHGSRFITFTRSVLLLSIALQFILTFGFANLGFREKLFFQNANQLGYHALLCASMFALPAHDLTTLSRRTMLTVGILMCVWIAVLSLSKAATIATMLFLLLSAARNTRQLFFGAALAIVVVVGGFDLVESRVQNLEVRFSTLG